MLVLSALSLQASGLVTGLHYGQLSHGASFSSNTADEKSAYGPGFMVGYDADSFRIIAMRSTPDFKEPQEATLTTLSAHLIDHEDAYLRGFLGVAVGSLDYRHALQSNSAKIDLYGLEVGLIFLDDRFERSQLELGYRYFQSYGDLPPELEMDRLTSFYVGLNFHFF